jgi:hypothetical protein
LTSDTIYVLVTFVPAAATLATATRFATLVEALCGAVVIGLHTGLSGPLVIRLWQRLTEIAARFAALGARPLNPRATPNHPPLRQPPVLQPPVPQPRPDPRYKTRRLPTAEAWLLRLLPEAEPYAEQVQAMLALPEFQALLQARPSLTRLLRPLCRMLGIEPPADPPPPEPAAPTPNATSYAQPERTQGTRSASANAPTGPDRKSA